MSAAVILVAGAAWIPAPAQAAAPPQITATWATEVTASSAVLHAEVDPDGLSTTYRFEYITEAAFQANLAQSKDGFTAAAKIPTGAEAGIGSGSTAIGVSQHLATLAPATTYHYRVTATNSAATTLGPLHTFTTQEVSSTFALPDGRGWELVSPLDKNGGAIPGPGGSFGGGVLQAAAQGGSITYSSTSSFGPGAEGSPPASQYLARREAGGWSTENLTVPLFAASYGEHPDGVPYQLFSPDLARALMLNGQRCRGEGTGCPVANPPLPGSGAPAGYQDYYLRDDENGAFAALLTGANAELGLAPEQFEVALAGASPDLRHLILSTCAALTPGATEVAGAEGCDPTEPNLYEWSGGALALINAAPGAELAAQGSAVSADGTRVYFAEAGKLWLREGSAAPHELATAAEFQTATLSGAFAFYTAGEKLFRYSTATHTSTELTPAGGVQGVLGASEDGSRVYYATAAGIFSWNGSISPVIATAGAATTGDYPPTTATARVSADGNRLLFLSKASLTGYDNTDANTGLPDSEVFLYDAGTKELTCLSCNPTGERPFGPSTIPGAISNGVGASATDTYKPRVLSASAGRVFFDSADALAAQDTNNRPDVYQWEAQGVGSCAKPGGCLSLISSGRGGEGASFIDASENASDAFFLTAESLVPADPGSGDLYDAREGGGFPQSPPPIECLGDACQPLPGAPEDPTVGTSIPSSGNPSPHPLKPGCPKPKHRVLRHGKARCLAKHHHRSKR